jgi:hypothetical protein
MTSGRLTTASTAPTRPLIPAGPIDRALIPLKKRESLSSPETEKRGLPITYSSRKNRHNRAGSNILSSGSRIAI